MGTRSAEQKSPPPTCGRYELLVRIGKGGMASVYLARIGGVAGFVRLYALKVMHPHLSEHQEFVDMLMDEAKIASRLHHPNVVSTVDLGQDGDRYYMVMDYVEGVALDRLLRRSPDKRDPGLIVPIAIDALRGLHAAHELKDDNGNLLELVHRDVTPGNVIVGADGAGRIADFGVAKARARITKTNPGIVKGKAGYIAPEVVLGHEIDGRADVFSMGVMLWNALTGETLFDTDDLASSLTSLLNKDVPPPSSVGLTPPPIYDAAILGALHRDPTLRHDTALEMAQALEDALVLANSRSGRQEIGEWVHDTFGPQLKKRRQYAAAGTGGAAWDPDSIEPPSTSKMRRRGPAGQETGAMPEPREGDDDTFAPTIADGVPVFDLDDAEVLKPSSSEGSPLDADEPERRSIGPFVITALVVLLLLVAGVVYWVSTEGGFALPETRETEDASENTDAVEVPATDPDDANEADPENETDPDEGEDAVDTPVTDEDEPAAGEHDEPEHRRRRRARSEETADEPASDDLGGLDVGSEGAEDIEASGDEPTEDDTELLVEEEEEEEADPAAEAPLEPPAEGDEPSAE